MDRNSFLLLIHKKFGNFKTDGADEVSVNCPFCVKYGLAPNTTYKLGLNLKKKVYHCFRCDVKGSLDTLIPQLSVVPIDTVVEDKVEDLEQLPECSSLDKLTYPFDVLVRRFLEEKNFTIAELYDRVLFCADYKKREFSFGPRLIFPIYQSGSYRGFQGRTIYKNTDPKYIGASNMEKRSIIYNYNKAFSQSKRLVVTEGFFDQMRVGDTAIATLGKIITDDQLRLIRLGSFEKVIVFLDADAKKESYENAKRLSNTFSTYVAVPTKKDPGEMTQLEIEKLFVDKLERVY